MNLLNLFVYSLFAFLISGCASFSYDIPDNISAVGSTGVIIFSTGAKKKSASSARNLVIRNSGGGKAVESVPIDNFALKSHFDDHVGFVHAINLEQGEYEVSLEVLNVYLEANNPDVFPKFIVRKGEVTYLGEVFLTEDDELYKISNKYDRDIGVILSSGSNLKKNDIKMSILKK